ncbi:unnamed protein product [Effrenium voratum]|nr:unnamed protein product [Effrenium voratum]
MLALPLVVLARDALHRRPRAPFCACEPQSTLRGVCPSGVRYYAARAHLGESEARTGALERAHVFALAEGGAAAQAAAELPQLAVAAWRQVLEEAPLWSRTADGLPLALEEAAAEVAAESLSRAFAWCDQRLAVSEPSSGLVCAVLRSGIYVASCGLARTAVGTDVDGLTVLCDEVMADYKHRLRTIDSAVAESAALEEAQEAQASAAKKELEQAAEEIKSLEEKEEATMKALADIRAQRVKAAAVIDEKRKELLEAERTLTMLEVLGKNKSKVKELEAEPGIPDAERARDGHFKAAGTAAPGARCPQKQQKPAALNPKSIELQIQWSRDPTNGAMLLGPKSVLLLCQPCVSVTGGIA